MNESKRSQTVIVSLIAALLIPRIQRCLGVTLTLDDVAALVAAAITVWHGLGAAGERICAVLERRFPPPVPMSPPSSEPPAAASFVPNLSEKLK
jgi:hypothetical protein